MNGTKLMIGQWTRELLVELKPLQTIKAITTGWLHPTINQYNLSKLQLTLPPNVKKQHEVNVGISNSFGFEGIIQWLFLHPTSLEQKLKTSRFQLIWENSYLS
ncbi:hypothetical protein HAX54_008966 [Datura stramonium]|uniref:beta-ketoacyl-[acyl-carrier-protein] synthase I n=1 Tax=Datura stramonium TaxID=4076 RepID=A0ABS8RVW7_DATST|nr:hypothetical protein [Datura stramonium]